MAGIYIMAVDQGTTGTTVLIVDFHNATEPRIVGKATVEFPQMFPSPGWVEHNLDSIWSSLKDACLNSISEAKKNTKGQFRAEDIASIGVTNQRETLCTFDRSNSQPLLPAMVWQDRRTASICQKLKQHEPFLHDHTGLFFDPYFSGTKMTWIFEHHAGIARKIKDGSAVFGTIDTYLVHRLTGGKNFVTEPSNASRTQIFDIKKGAFSNELASMLGLPHLDCLAEVRDSAGEFGKTSGVEFLPNGIPITGILGDQQAALAGQACFSSGESKCTYGTGAFLLLNTGAECPISSHGLITTVGWRLKNKLSYALEGSCFIAGASIQFLRDQLQFLKNAQDSEALSKDCQASPEVYFVPALSGLGAPYWDPMARGSFLGLTRGTTQNQLIRAALEGIAFSVSDLFKTMSAEASSNQNSLRVDGGACANNLLMQFQSDILGIPVDRPKIIETTAFGAALFAGLGLGIYKDVAELAHMRVVDRVFYPSEGQSHRTLVESQLKGWQRAVQAVQVFSGN